MASKRLETKVSRGRPQVASGFHSRPLAAIVTFCLVARSYWYTTMNDKRTGLTGWFRKKARMVKGRRKAGESHVKAT